MTVRWLLLAGLAIVGLPVDAELVSISGQTMGTTYSIKVHDCPIEAEKIQLEADRELRLVNDQMSTYLKSSEISRFNASESTDWFEVSLQTAEVVRAALMIGTASGGALDITIGGLVDRWNFGPAGRTQSVPDGSEIQQLRESAGMEKLHVRVDPPSLRKEVPGLNVDLSAIAKGHGVDRVVELLSELGCGDVFVEIGGEVRVTGNKAGEPWRVGIQRPDVTGLDALIAHPISDAAMATSGDYRNYFEAGGKRYSHTIDPATGRPVVDPIASVSVVAGSCMMADGWATALTVMGPTKIAAAVEANDLEAFWMVRAEAGLIGQGTGTLAAYEFGDQTPTVTVSEVTPAQASFLTQMLPLAAVTAAVLLLVIGGMAIGAMAGRASIGGSCGGLNAHTGPDGIDRCNVCDTPSTACKELRDQVAT